MSDKLRELIRAIRRDSNPDGDFVLSEAEAILLVSGTIRDERKAAFEAGSEVKKAIIDSCKEYLRSMSRRGQ